MFLNFILSEYKGIRAETTTDYRSIHTEKSVPITTFLHHCLLYFPSIELDYQLDFSLLQKICSHNFGCSVKDPNFSNIASCSATERYLID